MNTQSDAIPGTPSAAQAVAPAAISPSRRFYWSVRRELWESRSIYLAPLAVSVLILFGFLVSTFHVRERARLAMTLDPMKQHQAFSQPYDLAALLIMLTTFLVAIFYCLDALHGERRDRSILFWKSMPVSDVTTVLSKASIPLIVLPLLTFVFTVATQFVMLFMNSAALVGSGVSVTTLWSQLSVFPMWMMLLYHLVLVHGFWYAPFYGWFLLVSAWARRAPILWAFLPMLAIGLLEKLAFNTTHFGAMLADRMGGESAAAPPAGSMPMNPMTHLTPGHFLGSPGLWMGLAVTAIFLALAIRLRHNRGAN